MPIIHWVFLNLVACGSWWGYRIHSIRIQCAQLHHSHTNYSYSPSSVLHNTIQLCYQCLVLCCCDHCEEKLYKKIWLRRKHFYNNKKVNYNYRNKKQFRFLSEILNFRQPNNLIYKSMDWKSLLRLQKNFRWAFHMTMH